MAVRNTTGKGRSTQGKKNTAPTEESGRIQPQARELEEAVLGALMLEKDAYSIIGDILKKESFYVKEHELIFEAISHLAIQQKPIDILTVTERLRQTANLEAAGGASYIAQLSQKVVSSAHIEYHSRIIA
ncbi:replicative DNA helicase, partial [Bacteroidales bacterium OttesenSCG-928-J19]|nr:replicative DNA helicase [Bacteroidales bacterium OttesenSCG-928-J19]